MKIGLVGFGTVGKGVYAGLKNHPELGTIERICVKNPEKTRSVPDLLFTSDYTELIENEEIEVLIELIDDAEVAFDIVKDAIVSGKPVITANKKMIADRYDELKSIQEEYQGTLLFEGAVAGSIPILQLLRTHYKNQEITSIRGILNGSTNYILSQMHHQHLSLQDAIVNAQNEGFAESDPQLDISGMDIFYKSTILASLAFGKSTGQIHIQGLTPEIADTVKSAAERGKKIKLIAELTLIDDRFNLSIAPLEISANDPLYLVDQEYNAIEIEGSLSGKQVYIGKGAGSLPTASAVIQDLQELNTLSKSGKVTSSLSAA